jgi:F-type H+-transporting ATPase subunit b
MFLIPEVGTVIWMAIIFFIVVFIMGKFAWKPLIKALDDREKTITDSLTAAEEARALLKDLEKEKELIRNESKRERDLLIKEGNELKERIIAEAVEKARIEAERVITHAQETIRIEREAGYMEIKAQIANLSVEIASKIIESEMTDMNKHEKLVTKMVNDIKLN